MQEIGTFGIKSSVYGNAPLKEFADKEEDDYWILLDIMIYWRYGL